MYPWFPEAEETAPTRARLRTTGLFDPTTVGRGGSPSTNSPKLGKQTKFPRESILRSQARGGNTE